MERKNTMKRSKKAALMLMVPSATLLLASCVEQSDNALVYNNPTECASAGYNTAEQCQADYEEAKAMHPVVAPKYENLQECEQEYGEGKCEVAPQNMQNTQSSSGGFFMPMMMGYLMGQMMNSGSSKLYPKGNPQTQQPVTPPGNASSSAAVDRTIANQPLYKSRNDPNNFRTASNVNLGSGAGPIQLKPSQVKPQMGQVVRRSGFGAQASSRSTFGSFGG